MEYILMNKNANVCAFRIDEEYGEEQYTEIKRYDAPYPIGYANIRAFLADRKASKHNHFLRELMVKFGCDTGQGFIRVTHAASINDSFWIKAIDEDVSWEDVSLYDNRFSEVISKLAFEGLGLYGIQDVFVRSPELSTSGSFRKCWRKEDDGIYLYKAGSRGASNTGLEPYCECMASELAARLCPKSVKYSLATIHNELASKCRLVTDADTGFVPYSRLGLDNTIAAALPYYAGLGCEDAFRRMLVLDAITLNTDRHTNNHGILIDNNTLTADAIMPVFDLNLSLLPYMTDADEEEVGDYIAGRAPSLGSDFTSTGQMMLTPSIRRDLQEIKDFTFEFRGDDLFPQKRVEFIEGLVRKQIKAVLSKEKLQTKDVFVPSKKNVSTEQGKQMPKKDVENICRNIKNRISRNNIPAIVNSDDFYVHVKYKEFDVVVNLNTEETGLYKNGIEVGWSGLSGNDNEAVVFKISEMIDDELVGYSNTALNDKESFESKTAPKVERKKERLFGPGGRVERARAKADELNSSARKQKATDRDDPSL